MLDPKNKLETIKVPDQNIRSITCENLTWIDIIPPSESSIQYLKDNYHFDDHALEDCLSHRQVSKMNVFPDYLFFVFHFNRYDKNTRISSKRQWSAFIGENYIITIHTGELKSLGELFRECQNNAEFRKDYFSKGSGYMLYKIIDKAIDSYFPVLDKIFSMLEKIEDSVFDETVEATTELSSLRRDIITQRMVMLPTRILVSEMRNKLSRYTRVEMASNYDDLIEHLTKICQTLDECKEVVEVFKDADYTLASHRLNHVLRILNIYATIVLPFLAVSGIYGMNIALPFGLEHGSFGTFIVLMAIMILMSIGMLVLFRRRRWI
jgi:magnesium transporter